MRKTVTRFVPVMVFDGVFKDLYYVADSHDDYRRVWSVKKKLWLKPLNNSVNGYRYYQLSKDGYKREISAQQLMAQTFVPNPDPVNKREVGHLHGPHNNHSSDLRWMTHPENCDDPVRNQKISDALSVAIICVETGEVFKSAKEAYEKTGIQRANITACCTGKRKTAGGYHWKHAA